LDTIIDIDVLIAAPTIPNFGDKTKFRMIFRMVDTVIPLITNFSLCVIFNKYPTDPTAELIH
jgi:hypothetical protein